MQHSARRRLLAILTVPLLVAATLVAAAGPATAAVDDLAITGVIDGPLTGGVPKAIEITVLNDVADLSAFGIGSANNGGGTDGEEFTFPAVAASAGDHIYVASEAPNFTAFFGFAPTYVSGAASINGDDAVELFENGAVIDTFGDIDVNGDGEPWDYTDGWAYRNAGTAPDGAAFVLANWSFSGINALDGETTNDTAATPFPIGTYTVGGGGDDLAITGVIDGPLTGGVPKAIEITVLNDVADLSAFGIGSANNGGGTDGEEFTFPAVAASAGDHIYVASEAPNFTAFFGFAPTYVSGAASVNGDDAVELFENGAVIDTFGDIDVNGDGEPWDYTDGWAYRNAGTAPDGASFVLANWSFSGINALDGETTNGTAATPFPIGTYSADGGGGVGQLVISEIMFDPASAEDDNEWVEVANTGTASINLAGYVIDDGNPTAHPSANIAGGSVPAGGSAVLYNADDLTAAEFTTNWGPGINLVPVTNWAAMGLNNSGDTLGIWADFGSYEGDNVTQADALISITYDDVAPWPDNNGAGSFFLTDLAADATDGANWALSTVGATTPVFTAYTSNGGDIGSPGPTPPDPVVEIGVCAGPATLIHDIQGAGTASPLAGETHVIEGVVVGTFPGTDLLRGFFVQEEDADADADPGTSEGIFIFDFANATPLAIGDQVRVLGEVSEFNDLTEITLDELLVCSTGNTVPTPSAISLPVAAGSTFENVEGMNVTFPGDLVVTEAFSAFEFGEIALAPTVLPNPTEVAAPGAAANAQNDLNDRSRILLDDGSTTRNRECVDSTGGLDAGVYLSSPPQTTRIGDSVTDLTGVMNFSFGAFKVEPTSGDPCSPDFFTRTVESARPAAPPTVGGSLTVASFNVLNYFLTIDDGVNDARGADSAIELTRQRAKIVDAIVDLDADIVGLIELENDASSAPLADLAAATSMSFVNTGTVGTDAIAQGFLYDPATVAPIGAPAVLDSSVDPAFNDEKNRPALLQTFEEIATGARVNVVVNHFKSKGSNCNAEGDPDTGDEQGNCNLTRTSAATALATWLATDPTGNGDPDNLIIGDLNAYSMEDPIAALEGADYTDLVETLGNDAPSFIFRGEVGRLDHGLANAALLSQVAGAAVWAINMEEPRFLDYNDDILDAGENPFASAGDPNPVPLFVADEFRSSDHNPVVIGLSLSTPVPMCNGLEATIIGTPGNDRINGTNGDDVIVALGGNDTVFGRQGNDTICLGEGNDRAFGHDGDDSIFGENGNDRITGHNGDDTLDGGAGNDTILGNSGEDNISGGEDNDRLRGGPDNDIINGDAGIDFVYGDAGDDELHGGDDNDLVNGGSGDDVMTGGEGNDRLYGVNGDDDISGNAGDDRLFGGNNDDTLDGGADTDFINGAAGFDTCLNGETNIGCEA